METSIKETSDEPHRAEEKQRGRGKNTTQLSQHVQQITLNAALELLRLNIMFIFTNSDT